MAKKDETVTGITGKPIPKPRTAKQQYELEKKRRLQKHLGKNVGGVSYSADVNPYYNPRQRTFEEFISIVESILNQEESFSYGSSEYQDQLQKQRKEKEEKESKQREQRNRDLYRERVHGRGIRSYSKGKPGWIKNGKFTPDEDT